MARGGGLERPVGFEGAHRGGAGAVALPARIGGVHPCHRVAQRGREALPRRLLRRGDPQARVQVGDVALDPRAGTPSVTGLRPGGDGLRQNRAGWRQDTHSNQQDQVERAAALDHGPSSARAGRKRGSPR